MNDNVPRKRDSAGWVLTSGVCLITGFVLGGHFYTAGPGQFGGAAISSFAAVACLCCLLLCPSRPLPRVTTLVLAVLALMLVGLLWPRPLGNQDLMAITYIARQQTAEPVVKVERLSLWSVEVMTGPNGLPNMGNSGHWFRLVRTWRGWRLGGQMGTWDS